MKFKKNKKGFTLVELIVVVGIFGVILSAMLNFIKPANQIHNDIQATRDANVISSGIIEFLDDELRYATNVLVLQDYVSIPEVSEDGYVGSYGVSFSNCIVLDSNHFRGYGVPGYSNKNDDTAAKRMGATGQVLKVNKIDTDGFNLNNAQVVKGEAFYDNFKFDFKAGTNVVDEYADEAYYEDHLKSIQISVTAYTPVYENGEYVFKKKFDRGTEGTNEGNKTKNRGAVLNFTNINMDNGDAMDLEVYKGDPEKDSPSGAAKQEEDGYPIASAAPEGVTESQASFYGGSASRYTYIFYKKTGAKTADDGTCTIKFVTDTPEKNTAVGSPVKGFEKGKTFTEFPTATPISGYSSTYWLAPDGTQVKEDEGYVVNANTTFKLVYVPDPEPSPYTVTWINADETSYTTPGPVPVGKTATNGPPTGFDPDKYAPNEETGGWVEQITKTSYLEVPIDKDVTFVADLVEKYPVHFKFSDSDVRDGASVVKGKYAKALEEVPAAPEGKVFDKWVVSGDTTKDLVSTPITKETTFEPKFKDKPSEIAGWTTSYTASNIGATEWDIWVNNKNIGKVVRYNVKINFNNTDTSATISKFKVKLTLDKACNVYTYDSNNVDITGNGSKSISLAVKNVSITSGGSYEGFTYNPLMFDNKDVKITNIELESAS